MTDDFFCYACRDTGKAPPLLLSTLEGVVEKDVDCEVGQCPAHRRFAMMMVNVEREMCAQTAETFEPGPIPANVVAGMKQVYDSGQYKFTELLRAVHKGANDLGKASIAQKIRKRGEL